MALEQIIPKAEVFIATVEKSEVDPENLHYIQYVITYENLKKDPVEATPIFSFGYNSYRYPNGSRVAVVVSNGNFFRPLILGRIYDYKVAPKTGIGVPREGELLFNSGYSGASYFSGLGTSTSVVLGNSESQLTVSPNSFTLKFNSGSLLSLEPQSFSVSNENSFSFFQREQKTTLNSPRGFNVFSPGGGVYFEATTFTVVEKTGHFNVPKSKQPRPALQIENGYHNLKGIVGFYEYGGSLTFKVGTSKMVGGSTSVAWNVTEGDYNVNLSSGSYNLNCLDPTSAEFSVKLGPSSRPLSKLVLDTSSLSVDIGAVLPDKLKLGGGEFSLKVGNTPGLQSELVLNGTSGKLTVPGVSGSSSFEYTSTKVLIKNSGFTTATIEISGGKVTVTSASSGKIVLDGDVEVTGDVTVDGSTGVKVTSGDVKAGLISLKQHKHAAAVPGGPSPPLP